MEKKDFNSLNNIITSIFNLDKRQVKVLIKYIGENCDILMFPNESLLDILKAEKVLENWDKIEL